MAGAPEIQRPLQGTFASSWRAAVSPLEMLAGATVLIACTVALGPLLGVSPIVLAFVVWLVALTRLTWRRLRRIASWSPWHWAFVVGLAAVGLRACAMGLTQLVRGRDALFWNVDARYFVTLANSISRFGGVSDSLDYAGERLQYHAGPAWIAAALDRTMGIPVNVGMLILVPAVCVVVIGVFADRLTRALGVQSIPAMLAVVLALNLPWNPLGLTRSVLGGERSALEDTSSWLIQPDGIVLVALPLAIGFAGGWLLLDAQHLRQVVVGGVGLATLLVIKPQYFLGFGAVYAVAFVVRARRRAEPVPWLHLALVAVGVAAVAGVLSAFNPQRVRFDGLELDLLEPLRQLVHPGRQGFFSAYLFIGAVVVILVIAAVPALRAGVSETGFARPDRSDVIAGAIAVVIAAVVLLVAIDATTFLVDAADASRARAVGLANYVRSIHDEDFSQALQPVTLILVIVALALVITLLRRLHNALRFLPAAALVVLLLATLPMTVSLLRHPTGKAAPEWTEEAALARLLDRVDTGEGIWLSSDLADSGDQFYRPLRMVNVTALSDAQFYLANVSYVGWTRDDVVKRVRNVQRFFTTPWSPWHDRFLEARDIRYVLVRDRCPPAWVLGEFAGSMVGRQGDWTLLRVERAGRRLPAPETPWPAFTGEHQYGRADCLTGTTAL